MALYRTTQLGRAGTIFIDDSGAGVIMRHCRIHIAENDKALQRDLKIILRKSGYDVSVSDSGYPIVAMMDNWPDAFLIDIELPEINGIEVCKWLKTHESSRYIPVILLSGDPYLKIIAASANPDDYIEKPVVYASIITKIEECLLAEYQGAM